MMKLLLLMGIGLSCMSSQALEIKGFTPTKKITYKELGDVKLKMDVFNPEGHKSSDKRPVVLFFFGGGWKSGHTSQFHPFCEYFASRGIVSISVDYRVSSRHKTTPKECVKDAKSAMRWVRKHAAKLGVDPDKIIAGGGSAGGHIAAATALVAGFDEEGEDLNISCQPSALLLYNPVYDNSEEGYGYDRVKDYWKQISPMHNIDEKAPPTMVIVGDKDKLIPVETIEKYEAKMKEKGRTCVTHLCKGAAHGFFNHGSKYYDFVISETDQFLVSLGYLTAKEK